MGKVCEYTYIKCIYINKKIPQAHIIFLHFHPYLFITYNDEQNKTSWRVMG